ncbi:S-adenosylmethionine:tRNA ribosyltransferase-isomerase [Candidatus Saccharibacteria bacterium]|nr:S-adenosylmethionine:tRNA ribosyltransferase-isomerase [Candidatus Saccharibacteria bacterium]
MHSEWYHIPEDTIAVLKSVKNIDAGGQNNFFEGGSEPGKARNEPLAARGDGTAGRHPEKKVSDQDPRRIIALGTTVARTLEYYARTGKTEGEDDIFIYPGFEFKLVDALITNFHAPKSTVLMLASAFASWDHLKAAYDHAVAEKYHFLSYGDSMLIC